MDDPSIATSVASGQPASSPRNPASFHFDIEARISGVDAAQEALVCAGFTGRRMTGNPNIDLTQSADLACHTPLGMTWPKSFVHKDLWHSGTL